MAKILIGQQTTETALKRTAFRTAHTSVCSRPQNNSWNWLFDCIVRSKLLEIIPLKSVWCKAFEILSFLLRKAGCNKKSLITFWLIVRWFAIMAKILIGQQTTETALKRTAFRTAHTSVCSRPQNNSWNWLFDCIVRSKLLEIIPLKSVWCKAFEILSFLLRKAGRNKKSLITFWLIVRWDYQRHSWKGNLVPSTELIT